MINIIERLDNLILLFINNNIHCVFLDKTMVAITSLGNKGFIWIMISIILLISKKYRYIGLMTITALLLSAILGEGIFKNLVQRPRPFANIQAIDILITKPDSYSFPSGHTMSAFAAMGILVNYFKKWSFIFWAIAFLIGFSRLYLYVHFPSDVIIGAVLGFICSIVIIYIFKVIDLAPNSWEDRKPL